MSASPSANIQYPGLDLGGTSIKFGIVDSAGKVISQSSEPTRSSEGREKLLGQLGDIASKLLQEIRTSGAVAEYVGVVTPGAVDAEVGEVIGGSPNIPDWVGATIGGALSERLSIPILVENDARAMALAELRLGAAQGAKSAICLTLGTGIGGGLIIDGRLWRGASETAGEIGHTIVDLSAELTDGEISGTLENLASARALERRARRLLASGLTPYFAEVLKGKSLDKLVAAEIFRAYRQGDPTALRCLQETFQILGKSLAGFVNLLNPEVVIMGGGIVEAVPDLVSQVGEIIHQTALSSAVGKLKVLPASLGNRAGFIGAAILGGESPWREILNRWRQRDDVSPVKDQERG